MLWCTEVFIWLPLRQTTAILFKAGGLDWSSKTADGSQTASCSQAAPQTLQVSTRLHDLKLLELAVIIQMLMHTRVCLGGRGETTGRRLASMFSLSRSWTWNPTAAKTPVTYPTLNTSSTNSLLSSCIMGRDLALATTLPFVIIQKEVKHSSFLLPLLNILVCQSVLNAVDTLLEDKKGVNSTFAGFV